MSSGVLRSRSYLLAANTRLEGTGDGKEDVEVIDVTEILVHWHAGRSQAEIATSLGVNRKTVGSTQRRRPRLA